MEAIDNNLPTLSADNAGERFSIQQLNEYIYEKILGNEICEHPSYRVAQIAEPEDKGYYNLCLECYAKRPLNSERWYDMIPKYAKSLDEVVLVEKKVIERVGEESYYRHLESVVNDSLNAKLTAGEVTAWYTPVEVATAAADLRALACVEAHREAAR